MRGFAEHLFSRKIHELVERVRSLPPRVAADRCQRLLDEWAEEGMSEHRPDAVELLRQARDIALTRLAQSETGG
jgi:hypothetical protein